MATSKFQKGPDLKRFMVRGGFLLLRRISWLPRVLITYFYFAQTLSLSLSLSFSHTRAHAHMLRRIVLTIHVAFRFWVCSFINTVNRHRIKG